MNKEKIHTLFLDKMEQTYQALVETAQLAKDASTNEESKAENKYDTRGLEASYLAGAQAKRAVEFKEKIFRVQSVQVKPYEETLGIHVGDLVVLLHEDKKSLVFILPVGGESIDFQGEKIKSITVEAPLGKLMYKKRVGDDFLFKNKEYEILECY